MNSVMIRSADIGWAAGCYAALGLEHFACEQDRLVFEIYPGDGTLGMQLGFAVASKEKAVVGWMSVGGVVSSSPKESEWGPRAVLTDSDGYKIELIERSETARSAL